MNTTKTATEPQTIQWEGRSGTRYTYWIYPRGTKFNDGQPGNYIHSKETRPGFWAPVYIGQSKDLNVRLANHENRECVDSHGATHIHVHLNTACEEARLAEEKDLILKWQPACNTQHIR